MTSEPMETTTTTQSPSSPSSEITLASKSSWLVLSNFIMMSGWIRVVLALPTEFTETCETIFLNAITPPWFHKGATYGGYVGSMTSSLRIALLLSFIEVGNAVAGVTRSKPAQVLLFAVIRFGVEALVTPILLLPSSPESIPACKAWQRLFTVACWSIGDAIRFGCFFVDNLVPHGGSILAKRVRYTVGPILFPLGFVGEMLMVIAAANRMVPGSWQQLATYGAAGLWPLGFYPLYTQLLRQRRKFYASIRRTNSPQAPVDTNDSTTDTKKSQ